MAALDPTTADRILAIPTAPFEETTFGDITLTTTPNHPVTTYNGHPAIPRATGQGAHSLVGPAFTPSVNFAAFIAITGPSSPADSEWTLAGYGPFDIGVSQDTLEWAYVHGYATTNGGSKIIPAPFALSTFEAETDADVTVYAIFNNTIVGKGVASSRGSSEWGDGWSMYYTPAKSVAVTGATTTIETHGSSSADSKLLGIWYFDDVNINMHEARETALAIAEIFSGEPEPEPEPEPTPVGIFFYQKDEADTLFATKTELAGLDPDTSWDEVSGKPTTFPPDAHSHAWSEVTSKPTTFPPDAHSHAWSEVSGKPTTFPPSTHSHTVGDVTGLDEQVRDVVAALLVEGAGMTITVDDAANTITLASSGSGGGGGLTREVRHDNDGTYDYVGNAPDATAESASGWIVTRITMTSPPVVTHGTGTWTGRAGLTYS